MRLAINPSASKFSPKIAIRNERTSASETRGVCKPQFWHCGFATARNPESKRWRVGEIILRERGHAPALVHAARGLAPRARRAGCRVNEEAAP